MSKQLFEEANEAFVDDKYEEAYELYTRAVNDDNKTDDQFTSKVLSSRAQCALKLKKYTDALNDSDNAIQLDAKNIKAYLRKGIALYNQNSIDAALKVFLCGLEIDAANDQLKVWKEKCETDIQDRNQSIPATKQEEIVAPMPVLVPPLVPAKIKHSFYQSDSAVTIQMPIKGLKKEQVQVETTDTTLNVTTKIPSTGQNYSLELNLAYPIDSSRTTFTVNNSNIEVKLHKRQAFHWSSLEAQASASKTQPPIPMNRPVEDKTPSYPSSSLRPKNWDKIEAQIKKDEKDNKEETADANTIFQQLYRDSDENTRRAMNKSMYESGGTCLNMNWEEVSKGKVTCEPPDGMEWKKYDS